MCRICEESYVEKNCGGRKQLPPPEKQKGEKQCYDYNTIDLENCQAPSVSLSQTPDIDTDIPNTSPLILSETLNGENNDNTPDFSVSDSQTPGFRIEKRDDKIYYYAHGNPEPFIVLGEIAPTAYGGYDDEPTPVKEQGYECGGTWMRVCSPNGKYISVMYYCEDWRHCDICFGRRIKNYKGRIENATNLLNVEVLKLESQKANEALLELNKEDYLKLPSVNGGALFFDASKTSVRGSSVCGVEALPDGFDWEDLCYTQEGKRPSGGLGRIGKTKKEKEEDPDFEQVQVEGIILEPDVDEALVKEAEYEAIAKTSTLDPHTPEEIEEAILVRNAEFMKALNAKGIMKIKIKKQLWWVRLSSVNWFYSCKELIFKLRREGDTIESYLNKLKHKKSLT